MGWERGECTVQNILVTGANGFIGKNLLEYLGRREKVNIMAIGRNAGKKEWENALAVADVIYHLAGVNRTNHVEDFREGNIEVTEQLVSILRQYKRKPRLIYASSIQASLDNPYGKSKKAAEEVLAAFSQETGSEVVIYRLPNVFGKWCKPHYNSVVATFCFNLAQGLDISITDPDKKLELVYIDDVIHTFIEWLHPAKVPNSIYYTIDQTHEITVGDLARNIREFSYVRKQAILPDLSQPLTKYLYTTYLSYLDRADFTYDLTVHRDHRGSLFELLKSEAFGQIFVSRSNKGVVRGNHYHNTKVEKFCVIKGKAKVLFRNIWEDDSFSYDLTDEKIVVLDIPPGYTHSIENVSDDELIVLFWANEIFQKESPDTYPLNV